MELEYSVDSVDEGDKFFTVVKLGMGKELARLEWKESTPDIVSFASDALPTQNEYVDEAQLDSFQTVSL